MTRNTRSGPVRNPIGWRQRLHAMQGGPALFDLRRFDAPLARVNGLERAMGALTDEELAASVRTMRHEAAAGRPLEELQVPLFAIVREAARRRIGLRPYDVQVVAALAMAGAAVVEMQTGEGKTLAAVMPAALYALAGEGVHVLTVNDYLARRDAAWMAPVFHALGLSVSSVGQGLDVTGRRAAYRADVTYVTAREAGFDHLRDGLAVTADAVVHRAFHAAIVDEADSLMVDEARIPLVIAGGDARGPEGAATLAGLVAALAPGLHYDTDEHLRSVELTEAGIDQVEGALGCGPLHGDPNHGLLAAVNCALHAHVLLRRDVDYLVRHGRIEMIDEMTGRVVPDRRWPEGLQTALEAREGLLDRGESRTLASMTVRRFLSAYPHLSGMTGTAQDCAAELRELYGLRVVVIPPNVPAVRVDAPDVVFRTRAAKEQAVGEEVRRAAAAGRPVLVGTLTVAESERLAERLAAAGVACRVLNARHDAEEAAIVAEAGAIGAVTIATNMAGRGTDIRLGGAAGADRDGVAALGGLYVIGTNRHESRRVDLQLRGRAGRQGDPGESRFFVSLEDELFVRFGLRDLVPGEDADRHGRPIESPLVRREIARAQRIADGQNREIRRALLAYSAVIEQQYHLLAERRQDLLLGKCDPAIWQRRPGERAALVAAAGKDAVARAERTIALHAIDRAWSDHLSLCAELREGSPLARLGGQEPLHRFTRHAVLAFEELDATIGAAVLDALPRVRVTGGALDLGSVDLGRPSTTWTHLLHDDPFRNQIGALLAGTGGVTVAIYSAALLTPLLLLWGVVEKMLRRRPPRRPPPPAGGGAGANAGPPSHDSSVLSLCSISRCHAAIGSRSQEDGREGRNIHVWSLRRRDHPG